MCKKTELGASEKYGFNQKLLKAESVYPVTFTTKCLGWFLATFATTAFIAGPLMHLIPIFLLFYSPKAAATLVCINVALIYQPLRPWPAFRSYFQLFYQIFDLHHNLSPEAIRILSKDNQLTMTTMHPHGIIPLQGFIGFALCEQMMPATDGIGATTDAALLLPILRHILVYLKVGPAKKEVILDAMVNQHKNILISPGGVAEIFMCRKRPKNAKTTDGQVQSIKARRFGLMKLALQTGSTIHPSFFYGVTDMFDQLLPVSHEDDTADTPSQSTSKSSISNTISKKVEAMSRKFQGGFSLFWGQYYLPIPHNPKVTFVMGDPIYPVNEFESVTSKDGKTVRICKRVENPTKEQVEDLVDRYCLAMERLFEQYKVEAGYPNDTIQVL